METTKKWYQSKTIWINILLIVGAIIADLANTLSTQTTFAFSLMGLLGIVFRAITKNPISW